jgi:hypothetical protein
MLGREERVHGFIHELVLTSYIGPHFVLQQHHYKSSFDHAHHIVLSVHHWES